MENQGLSLEMSAADKEAQMAQLMAKQVKDLQRQESEAMKSDSEFIIDKVTDAFMDKFSSMYSQAEGHEGVVEGEEMREVVRSWFDYARNAYVAD